LDVRIYDLSGRRVFTGTTHSPQLVWRLHNRAGHPIPSGTYLYVAAVRAPDSQIHQNGVSKLLVLR